MMGTPTFKMLWLTLLLIAGLTGLVAADEASNRTSSTTASPKSHEAVVAVTPETMTKANSTKIVVHPTPPFAAVMDLFQAPLAAFKPKMAPQNQNTKSYEPLGRAETNAQTTARPNNIFFRAGSNLGSAASSLTGWFNNRMIPQALRPASTTSAPQIIRIMANPPNNRRKALPQQQKVKRPQANRRRRPVSDDTQDLEQADNDENIDDEEIEDEVNFNLEQEGEEDDEDEFEYAQVGNRKKNRQTKKRPNPNQQYFIIEEEMGSNDDLDYDVELPVKKPKRKQQQQQKPQNIANKRKKNNNNQQIRRRRPIVVSPNSQNNVQIVQRPGNSKNKRKRRPGSSYELVPISPNQALNAIQTKQKPNQQNNNQQSSLAQFFRIPWSRLGLSGPSNQPTPKPIIVQVPQQNINRKRRPNNKPSKKGNTGVKNPKQKGLRGQPQGQQPVFAMLNEDQIRELLSSQTNQQPEKVTAQLANLPVTLRGKKKKDSKEKPSNNEDAEQVQEPQADSQDEKDEDNSYIVVGPADDDKEIDLDLYRHNNGRRNFNGRRISSRRNNSWEDEIDDDVYDIDEYDDEE